MPGYWYQSKARLREVQRLFTNLGIQAPTGITLPEKDSITPFFADLTAVGDAHYLASKYVISTVNQTITIRNPQRQYAGQKIKIGDSIFIHCATGHVTETELAVLRDLNIIYCHPSGMKLIHSLNLRGIQFQVVIVPTDGFLDPATALVYPETLGRVTNQQLDQAALPGIRVAVYYNPHLYGLGMAYTSNQDRRLTLADPAYQPGAWGHPGQKPPDVSLFHELVHADDYFRGQMADHINVDRGNTLIAVKLSEVRCVGLDRFSVPGLYSENSYRSERGVVRRSFYTQQAETVGPGSTEGLAMATRMIWQAPVRMVAVAPGAAATAVVPGRRWSDAEVTHFLSGAVTRNLNTSGIRAGLALGMHAALDLGAIAYNAPYTQNGIRVRLMVTNRTTTFHADKVDRIKEALRETIRIIGSSATWRLPDNKVDIVVDTGAIYSVGFVYIKPNGNRRAFVLYGQSLINNNAAAQATVAEEVMEWYRKTRVSKWKMKYISTMIHEFGHILHQLYSPRHYIQLARCVEVGGDGSQYRNGTAEEQQRLRDIGSPTQPNLSAFINATRTMGKNVSPYASNAGLNEFIAETFCALVMGTPIGSDFQLRPQVGADAATRSEILHMYAALGGPMPDEPMRHIRTGKAFWR